MNDYSPVYRRCGCTDPTTGRRYGDTYPRLAADPGHGSGSTRGFSATRSWWCPPTTRSSSRRGRAKR